MTNHAVGTATHQSFTAHRLDVAGWGLFCIWIGITLLAHLGWGIGLLGIGILIAGGQLVRKYMGLRFEAFWAVIGALFAIGGVSEILSFRLSLIPILCVLAGVALLVSALVSKQSD